jgi:lysozyme
MMQTSENGLDIIRKWEGLQLTAYRCPAGVWTIGYGHTGPDVWEGKKIDIFEANILLRQDVRTFEDAVNRAVKIAMSQGMFDSLVSFTYNVGAGNLRKSTLLKKLNAGKIGEAAEEFKKWDKAGRKVLAGLAARREDERRLFLS